MKELGLFLNLGRLELTYRAQTFRDYSFSSYVTCEEQQLYTKYMYLHMSLWALYPASGKQSHTAPRFAQPRLCISTRQPAPTSQPAGPDVTALQEQVADLQVQLQEPTILAGFQAGKIVNQKA